MVTGAQKTDKTIGEILVRIGPWIASVLLAWFAYEARELKTTVATGQTKIGVLEAQVDVIMRDQARIETKLDNHIDVVAKKVP